MIIDFLPDYATWEEWNGNLIHFFSEQQFPMLPEEQWPEVAYAIGVSPAFDKYGIPEPDMFSDWRDWAKMLTLVVNGQGT